MLKLPTSATHSFVSSPHQLKNVTQTNAGCRRARRFKNGTDGYIRPIEKTQIITRLLNLNTPPCDFTHTHTHNRVREHSQRHNNMTHCYRSINSEITRHALFPSRHRRSHGCGSRSQREHTLQCDKLYPISKIPSTPT